MVQPGKLVANARKYASRKRRVGAHHSGNLRQIASVITRKRVYNLEFTDYSDLKSFYDRGCFYSAVVVPLTVMKT